MQSAGGLATPKSLFDPSVEHLTALLPQESFPDGLFSQPAVLHSLRSLGLCSSLTCVWICYVPSPSP